jgi:hypothetical protein
MPARSRIYLDIQRGRVTVLEKLTGKGEAIGGIVFGIFMLVYMAVFIFRFYGGLVMLGPFWLAEAIVLVMVVHQTWRKTLLVATADGIDLKFSSAFTSRTYRWPAAQVEEVLSMPPPDAPPYLPLAEMRIRLIGGSEVLLFADHPTIEVEQVADAVRAVLSGSEVSK